MDSCLVLRRDRVILNQWTKRDARSFKRFSKTSLILGFPIRKEILNVSQIGKAFHGICPPIFIQTWLQQYCRGAFFHSAHCSLSNPISFRSVWCRRTMIPRKIFTGFAKFHGIFCVNDFTLPIRLQELLQAPFRLLGSFRFARIRLNPLCGKILHHDCVSMIVPRCTALLEDFVICRYQITNFFCSRYCFAISPSARSPCYLGSLADFAISVFWRVCEYSASWLPLS